MNKSKKLKRKTFRLLAKNLIVLVVLIAITMVGVRSWFTTSSSATAGGITAKTEVPAGLEIAIVAPGATPSDSDWQTETTVVLNSQNYDFLDSINMSQVTGDGKTFISPYLMQDEGIAIVDNNSTWDPSKIIAKPNEDYLSFDIYMRTQTSGKKVVLTPSTYCGPTDPGETYAPTDNKINPASVAGALRLSAVDFTNYTTVPPVINNRNLLWIPAPHIYYAYDTIWTATSAPTSAIQSNLLTTSNTYGLAKARNTSTNALTNEYASTYNGTYKHTYWSYNSSTAAKTHSTVAYGTNKQTNTTAYTNQDYKLHENVSIGSLTYNATISGKSYKVNRARINLWIEGEDPEARAAQVAGDFTLSLNLDLVDA